VEEDISGKPIYRIFHCWLRFPGKHILIMKERRKIYRKPLHYFTHVYDRKTRQLIGYLVDVSPSGGQLVTEKEIPLESLLYLQVDLPAAFEQKILDITSRVIWCETDPGSDLFNTGVEWVNLEPEVQALFSQMIS
jgi:hypothetical protein